MNIRPGLRIKLRNQQGFTLLELLIALLLTGLITTLIFGGLSTTIRVWETLTERNEQTGEALTVRHFIRQRLVAVADERVASVKEGTLVVAFIGLKHELIFTGFIDTADSSREMTWLYLRVNNDDQLHPRLQLSTAPYDNVEEVDWEQMLSDFRSLDSQSYTLLSGTLRQIRFEYLEDEPDGLQEWHDEWIDRYVLPQLIRVTFETEDEQRSVWPKMIVVPREHSYVIKTAS